MVIELEFVEQLLQVVLVYELLFLRLLFLILIRKAELKINYLSFLMSFELFS